jgi:hypothetical protein
MENADQIIICCPLVTPRITYTANFIFSHAGTGCRFISESDIQNINGMLVINYNRVPRKGMFNIFSSGLLEEKGLHHVRPNVVKTEGLPSLFPAPEGFNLTFDIFSAIFYLISRYEEYQPFNPDQFGRFEASQSLLYRHQMLEVPLVDQWMLLLFNLLVKKYPYLRFASWQFSFQSTIDIDNPWAYQHKGYLRTCGGIIKALLKGNRYGLQNRLAVLTGHAKDPYDSYDIIHAIEKRYDFQSVFFFLLGDYGGPDSNYSLHTPHFRKLIGAISKKNDSGIHPSFRSNNNPALLEREFKLFRELCGKTAIRSRQHFLVQHFPDTFRNLIKMGIMHDYSMGYASHTGFRAGTTKPFRFYDLTTEQETGLVMHPFVVMDVTLQQHLGLAPEEALKKIQSLVEKIKAVNGTFTSLWHNESIADQGIWKGWRRVYEKMIITLSKNGAVPAKQ